MKSNAHSCFQYCTECKTEHLFPKRIPDQDEELCPYDGIAYKDVLGYVCGYGCPVCKGISFHHLPVPKGTKNKIGRGFCKTMGLNIRHFFAGR